MNPLTINVTERPHSMWGGSKASRWGRCPMSVVRSMAGGGDATVISDEMRRGTAVHALGEWILNNAPCVVPPNVTVVCNEGAGSHVPVPLTFEDLQAATDYAHEVLGVLKKFGAASMHVEKVLRLSEASFGIADAVLVNYLTREIVIFDYKNGAHPVAFAGDGIDQAGFLACAAMAEFPAAKAKTVTFHYVQPNRRDGGGPISSKIFFAKELKDLSKTFLRAASAASKADGRDAWYTTGDHCTAFAGCPHLKDCPEYPEMAKKATAIQFSAPEPKQIGALIMEKGAVFNVPIKDILAMKKSLTAWFEVFEEAVTAEALATGEPPVGMKFVQGRAGKRTWRLSDEETSAELVNRGISTEFIYEPPCIKTPAQLDKVIKGRDLSDLVVQKDGKPVLAPIEDPRPGLCINEFSVIDATKTV